MSVVINDQDYISVISKEEALSKKSCSDTIYFISPKTYP